MARALDDDGRLTSGGTFSAVSDRPPGMTPADFVDGRGDAVIRFAIGECSLGLILVAQSAKGICAILPGDSPEVLVHELQNRFPRATLVQEPDAGFGQIVATVAGFVEHPAAALDLPLDVRGTAFQRRVWRALQAIPAGSTASYGEIAARIGAPRGARAVAQACGSNALAVAIPCHRVVRLDGSLSGYRWGIDRKRILLETERGTPR